MSNRPAAVRNQKADKRCVFVMRQKIETVGTEIRGANKTLTFIIKAEDQKDVSNLTNTFVEKGSVLCADESNAYDVLHAKFDTRRWANGEIFTDITKKCAHSKTSRDWCGYWQGNKRDAERLAA